MSWRAALSRNIQELRIQFCQHSAESNGLKQFVSRQYPVLKQLNPSLPILVRESQGSKPRLVARYDWGNEAALDCSSMSEQEIALRLQALTLQGEDMPRSAESKSRFVDII
eukprot:TRINITY_DN5551_c0_g1_i1.p2 TRINITY_DN5551_c0_g1~~TRINITY_DN5551_c0_g1_i1.p2  ORF type:complete len:111 (-),score=29.76 TRINITY_DN5551_c0_g1_i1:205-537(-)